MSTSEDKATDAVGVLALRRAIYAQAAVTRADLSRLIAAGRAVGDDACPEFAALLAEVATDLIVEQVDPPKYISPADADWLMDELHEGHGPRSLAEFQMLIDVMRYAVSVPASLAAFTVAETEAAITAGHSPFADGMGHAAGVVTRDHIDCLRNAVFAATSGSSLHVTRASAEALFRIAHATAGADNDADFDDFFAEAIGNYLMGICFHWQPSVEAELGKENWLEERPTFGAFLGHMFGRGAPAQRRADVSLQRELQRENEADAREIAAASRIGASDAEWLLAHLTRDGKLTSAEIKLLFFLKQHAASMPADLLALVDEQAAA